MSKVVVSVAEFKTKFQEFKDNEYIAENLNNSLDYIDLYNNSILKDNKRKKAIYLLTAHLLTLRNMIMNGDTSLNQLNSSSIGSVSVSTSIPNNKDSFDYWLNLTGYGKELLFLLTLLTPTSIYFNGSFQRILK